MPELSKRSHFLAAQQAKCFGECRSAFKGGRDDRAGESVTDARRRGAVVIAAGVLRTHNSQQPRDLVPIELLETLAAEAARVEHATEDDQRAYLERSGKSLHLLIHGLPAPVLLLE